MSSVRLAASRTTAKASCSNASSASPCARRALNSSVLARNSLSESVFSAGSSAFIRATSCIMRFIRRSLRVPNTFFASVTIIYSRPSRNDPEVQI